MQAGAGQLHESEAAASKAGSFRAQPPGPREVHSWRLRTAQRF